MMMVMLLLLWLWLIKQALLVLVQASRCGYQVSVGRLNSSGATVSARLIEVVVLVRVEQKLGPDLVELLAR